METHGLKCWRVNLLRLAFAVMAVGLAVTQWPLLTAIGPAYDHLNAVVICLFSALGLMAFVGVFRPLEMLPVMLFEIVWKAIWLSLVGMPAWLTGDASPAVARSLPEVALIVVFVPLVPWDYVWGRYFRHRAPTTASMAGPEHAEAHSSNPCIEIGATGQASE